MCPPLRNLHYKTCVCWPREGKGSNATSAVAWRSTPLLIIYMSVRAALISTGLKTSRGCLRVPTDCGKKSDKCDFHLHEKSGTIFYKGLCKR